MRDRRFLVWSVTWGTHKLHLVDMGGGHSKILLFRHAQTAGADFQLSVAQNSLQNWKKSLAASDWGREGDQCREVLAR